MSNKKPTEKQLAARKKFATMTKKAAKMVKSGRAKDTKDAFSKLKKKRANKK